MKYRILAAAGALVLAGLAIFHPVPHPTATLTVEASSDPTPRHVRARSTRTDTAGTVVYVVGAVNRPGLYHIGPAARADDAVRAAGGMRPDADPAGVNLAAFAHDGDEVDVPTLGQSISSVVHHRLRSLKTRKKVVPAVVDVNTADVEALATVPGIGRAIAARIVAVRERDGAYDSFDQLLDVAGMTQSRLDRAQPYLRI